MIQLVSLVLDSPMVAPNTTLLAIIHVHLKLEPVSMTSIAEKIARHWVT